LYLCALNNVLMYLCALNNVLMYLCDAKIKNQVISPLEYIDMELKLE